LAKGVYHGHWEKSFDKILTPLDEFIHRQTTSGVLPGKHINLTFL
jgi:NhaA family Na+:H+ antiporter